MLHISVGEIVADSLWTWLLAADMAGYTCAYPLVAFEEEDLIHKYDGGIQ